jgi:AcrR family transcriptional regulator
MASRAGTRGVPRQAREEQMLDMAARVFGARGYHAASMAEIADGIGTSKTMLYAYFGSKEQLYMACLDRAGGLLIERMRSAAPPEMPAEERLWAGTLAFFDHVAERRAEWSVLYKEAVLESGPLAAKVAELRQEIANVVKRVVEQAAQERGVTALDEMHSEAIAQAVVGAGESLANWSVRDGSPSTEELATLLMNSTWNGIRPLLDGKTWSPPSET